MRTKGSVARTLGLGLAAYLSSVHALAEVSIEQGYFRASPPGVKHGAAFMTLHNSGTTPVSLTRADTEAANSTELHNHIEQDGVMRMRQVGTIEIPAKGSVNLQPGGYHIMLMGLKAPLIEGQKATLSLEFSSGQREQLLLPIQKIQTQQMPSTMTHSPQGMSMQHH